jgi:hypothetical protein
MHIQNCPVAVWVMPGGSSDPNYRATCSAGRQVILQSHNHCEPHSCRTLKRISSSWQLLQATGWQAFMVDMTGPLSRSTAWQEGHTT